MAKIGTIFGATAKLVRRVFLVLREMIGDLKPWRFAAYKDVALGSGRQIVQNGERNANFATRNLAIAPHASSSAPYG
jgi:hypothetical protein